MYQESILAEASKMAEVRSKSPLLCITTKWPCVRKTPWLKQAKWLKLGASLLCFVSLQNGCTRIVCDNSMAMRTMCKICLMRTMCKFA